MNGSGTFETALREAMLRGPAPEAGRRCPPPDTLWLGARGELPARALEAAVDHVAACGECAEAWSLARRDLAGESAQPPATASRNRPRLGRGWALAAAVLGVALVAGLFLFDGGAPPGSWRTGAPDASGIQSLVPETRPLARSDVVLRWSGAPEGSRYHVRVTDERLQVLLEAQGLERPELRVPPERLAGVPDGGRIYWRVEAELPGGGRIASPTFVQTVAAES